MKSYTFKKIIFNTLFAGIIFSFAYISNASNDIMLYEGDPESYKVIHGDDSTDDISLYFGDSLTHFLKWDADKSIFVFSDNVDFGGNQALNMRIENLNTAPNCEKNESGRLYYNSNDKESYVCNGDKWKQIDEEINGVAPYISNITPSEIKIKETNDIIITGGGFSPNTTVEIPLFTGEINNINIISPTQISIEITPNTEDSGLKDIIITANNIKNTEWTNNEKNILNILNPIILVPEKDGVIWVRKQNVDVSEGQITPSNSDMDWEKGASFESIPANKDFTLSFYPKYMSGKNSEGIGIIGLDNSDPDKSYKTIDYGFFLNDTTLRIYENNKNRGNFGTFDINDNFKIKRVGSIISYYKNDNLIYTSNIPYSGKLVFDTALYRYIGATKINIEY
jgi:hypothetical protein